MEFKAPQGYNTNTDHHANFYAGIREGKPIPRGYVLVGQQVDIQRGAKTAGAALRFTCPGAKRLMTFGTTGDAG